MAGAKKTVQYRTLNGEKTIETLQQLSQRISERFPTAGLYGVSVELGAIARETNGKIDWISRPLIAVRTTIVLLIAAAIAAALWAVQALRLERAANAADLPVSELIGMLEAGTNELILLGAAIYFLISVESRIKRTRALSALHDLRAVAHVIDMHQLTKDPNQILAGNEGRTKSSPDRTLTPFQLTRYLDYCSEMLSLIGKLAALYAQSIPDSVVVGAVNDIETLTTSLSRKVWQKIVLIQEKGYVPVPGQPASSESAKPASEVADGSGGPQDDGSGPDPA